MKRISHHPAFTAHDAQGKMSFRYHQGYKTMYALSAICLAGLLTSSGAEQKGKLHPSDGAKTKKGAAKRMNVTKEDLEKIRDVVVHHYQNKKPEFWEAFVKELHRGAIFMGDTPSIGIWEYEVKNNRATLTRQPPVSPTMHYFGVYLDKPNNKWVVTEEFHQIEKLEISG